MDDELNDAVQILLEMKNDVGIEDDVAPPAEIFNHVPAADEELNDDEQNYEGSEDDRRRGLLLTSLGPLAAMMGAGFIFIKQLFKEQHYNVYTLFKRPTFGEFIVDLTSDQKQQFCSNTAYYIDAMRGNKPLEVITDGGVQKFRPSSSRDSTAVTVTPSKSMKLYGNEVIEKNEAGELVYKHGQKEILIPEDPIEISAFCMAHFFNTENVQILMNWGDDFKLISEADLLRLLGEMREGNDWKQKIVGNLFDNAYKLYKNTGPYLKSINETTESILKKIRDIPMNMEVEVEMVVDSIPKYKERLLNHIARNYPKLWGIANTANDYPIPSALFALYVLYTLRKPLGAAAAVLNEFVRLPNRIYNWLTGNNPDKSPNSLAIEDGHRGGALRGGGKQPPNVIVINHPLPEIYIVELSKLFDKGSIRSFVKRIEGDFKETNTRYVAKKGKKAAKTVKKVVKYGFRGKSKKWSDSPRSVNMELDGGKRLRSNKKLTRRKHKKNRKTLKR